MSRFKHSINDTYYQYGIALDVEEVLEELAEGEDCILEVEEGLDEPTEVKWRICYENDPNSKKAIGFISKLYKKFGVDKVYVDYGGYYRFIGDLNTFSAFFKEDEVYDLDFCTLFNGPDASSAYCFSSGVDSIVAVSYVVEEDEEINYRYKKPKPKSKMDEFLVKESVSENKARYFFTQPKYERLMVGTLKEGLYNFNETMSIISESSKKALRVWRGEIYVVEERGVSFRKLTDEDIGDLPAGVGSLNGISSDIPWSLYQDNMELQQTLDNLLSKGYWLKVSKQGVLSLWK